MLNGIYITGTALTAFQIDFIKIYLTVLAYRLNFM